MFVMLSNHVDGCVASFNFSAFLIFYCQYSCCFLLLTFYSTPCPQKRDFFEFAMGQLSSDIKMQSAPSLTTTHVNLHTHPLPISVHCTKARKRVIEKEGEIQRGKSVRLGGWESSRH